MYVVVGTGKKRMGWLDDAGVSVKELASHAHLPPPTPPVKTREVRVRIGLLVCFVDLVGPD